MDLLSIEQVKTLTNRYPGWCLSIFMPTHRAGKDTQQDPIRFKNLLKEAEERLVAVGLRSPEARGLLEPAQRLLTDSAFWRHQSDGLALFLSPEVFRFYRLPLNFDEMVIVGGRFHVKPLLSLFTNDGHFFVLALSQKQIRLLEGTRYSVDEVDLEGVPASLAEALRYDNLEKQLQFRTVASGGTGKQMAMFHGHGAAADVAKDRILRYFHQVNDGLRDMLRGEQAPLVLAGVEYLFPLYKEANTYPHLMEAGIPGNPEVLKPEGLHAPAWAIVQPHFMKGQQEAIAQYGQLAGTGRASADLQAIIPAAYHGRVAGLFAAVGVQQWGSFDPGTNIVHLHTAAEAGDEDLLDLAAVHTLVNGGVVYAVPPTEMPDDAPLAAVFRY